MEPAKPVVSLDLQDLLTRAMARQTPHKPRRRPDDQIDPKELAQAERRLRERFSLPENWLRVRSVALIHQDTETLLGNFIEFKHKLSTARKFMRAAGPEPVEAVEFVKGENWLAEPLHRPSKPAVPEREMREAMIDVHLPELENTFAKDVILDVHLHWGSIARVELMDETVFHSKDRKTQLYLPEGLDILDGMSLECRIKLKEFLGL